MKKIILVLLAMAMVLSFAACGKKVDSPLVGKWAYIHDTETTVLEIKNNGKAVYDGSEYKFESDDTFITLTDKNGKSEKFRYEIEKDGLLFYKNAEYVRDEGDASSVVGIWKGKEVDKWTFEFNDKGEFQEDGYFPGYYTVDESNKSIKLIYNDHFEDTVCYFELNGNEMVIQYPWKMVTSTK